MARLSEPDLRSLAVALLEEGHCLWPEIVLAGDADRLRDCTNVLLVGSRVAVAIAKRAGMPLNAVSKVIERAKWVPDPVDLMEPIGESRVVDGKNSVLSAMWNCDWALHNPASRARMPEWFVNRFYPDLCKRVASRGRVTDRDKEIVMYWTSVARGER